MQKTDTQKAPRTGKPKDNHNVKQTERKTTSSNSQDNKEKPIQKPRVEGSSSNKDDKKAADKKNLAGKPYGRPPPGTKAAQK